MKYCKNCGQSLEDTVTFCTQCGAKCEGEQTQTVSGSGKHNGLTLTAMIFFAISIGYGVFTFFEGVFEFMAGDILGVFGVIAMIAGIVNCVVSGYFGSKLNNAVKNNTKLSTAQKVCSLIFGNIISGICLLCDKEH